MVDEVEVDYGEQTPEHFDRFGVHHYARLTTRHRVREFLDAEPRGIVKRLGLTLQGWGKRWPGVEIFHLYVWDRPLEIRSYSDGRIKLFLDGQPVYTENTKVVTAHGVKRREVQRWYDPVVEREEREDQQRQRHTAAYDELKSALRKDTP